MDLEETEVAQEFATSSGYTCEETGAEDGEMGGTLTGSVVVGIEQGEEGADGEDVGVLVGKHFGGGLVEAK